MQIIDLKNVYQDKYLIFEKDENGREINIYKFKNINFLNNNLFYPNCLFKYDSSIINPVDEQIMSLKNVYKNRIIEDYSTIDVDYIEETPVFYFVYNTDNYYHFIYDTLPYLISYKKIKKSCPKLKLLINYPNYQSKKLYPFVKEFLELCGICDDDLVFVNSKTIYKTIYVSSSYTHGINSNLPPRKEIYSFYNEIVSKVNEIDTSIDLPKQIYISRRTWKHNNTENIGTNYTTRRKCINEDELVKLITDKGYVEVFTENLSTIKKIKLFSQVESVIAPIGGGSCNLLFSNPNTKHYCIVSPTFLDVNERFVHSLNHVNTIYYTETEHVENGKWKKYIRAKCGNVIGEIEDVKDDDILISHADTFVAGWNSNFKLTKSWFSKDCVELLDSGLNSAWKLDINNFEKLIG